MINNYPLTNPVLHNRVSISINNSIISLLQKNRISFKYKKYSNILISKESIIEPYSGIYSGNYIPTIGAFSYSNSELPWGVSIGRYCSIARGFNVFGADHFIDWISTSPYFYTSDFQNSYKTEEITHQEREKRRVNIGNDVWIGEGVTVKKDITIGTGAIVAAKSVVTKDIPPYAIVAGIPARIIRFRFPDDIIRKSLEIEWWKYHLDDLKNLGANSPIEFLNNLENKINNVGLQAYTPPQNYSRKLSPAEPFLLSIH